MTNVVSTQTAESKVEGVIAQWTAGKRQKTAHTEVGLMMAPKAAKDTMAKNAVLNRLNSGRYDGFSRDIYSALSIAHRKAFASYMGNALSPSTIAGAKVSIDLEVMFSAGGINKETFRLIAAFVVSPRAEVKGVEMDKPLPKTASLMVATCEAWLAANAPKAVTV